jgi:hypothetical protein
MIVKRVTTEHATKCDGCGVQIEWVASQAEAKARAKAQGWTFVRSWDGQAYVERDYCSACTLERNREPKE